MSLKSVKALFQADKKQYSPEAKQKAARYAFANFCVQLLLLAIIVQCVWLGRMGVHTLAQAHQHLFLSLPVYDKMVHFFFAQPKLAQALNPLVWPYVPFLLICLLANFLLSYRASRVLRNGLLKS